MDNGNYSNAFNMKKNLVTDPAAGREHFFPQEMWVDATN